MITATAQRAAVAPGMAASGVAWAARLEEGSAYVLLFLLPFSKAAIEVACVVWWIGWLLRLRFEGRPALAVWLGPRRGALAAALGGFLAICGLSVLWSHYPDKSFHGFVGKWLQYLWLFVMAVDVGARPGVLSRAAAVMAASSVLVALEAVSQHWLGQGLLRRYPFWVYGRETGPYENPIDLATYVAVVCPLVAGLAIDARGLKRGLFGGVAAGLAVLLMRTEALGAWVALAAGAAVVVGLAFRRRLPARLLVAVLLIAGAAGVLRTLGWGGALRMPETGTMDRWVMWQAGFAMVRDRPLLGHGVNTFMANYLDYWVGGEHQPRYAHNCYLQVAAETGLIGLALFLMTLGAVFRRVLTRLDRLPAGRRGILLGGAVALAAFAVQAAIDTNFYALRQAALFWVLAGLLVGCREQERSA